MCKVHNHNFKKTVYCAFLSAKSEGKFDIVSISDTGSADRKAHFLFQKAPSADGGKA